MTVIYTPDQKLAYFNSVFFTDTIKIKDYLYLIYEYCWKQLSTDFSDFVDRYRQPFIIYALVLIILILITLFIMPKWYSSRVEDDTKAFKSTFNIISFQTIIEDPKLKH